MDILNQIPPLRSDAGFREEDLEKVVDELSVTESLESVYHVSRHDFPMPSIMKLASIVDTLKAVIFPGYFAHSEVKPETMRYYIGASLDHVFGELAEQIKRGYCFACAEENDYTCEDCDNRARNMARVLLRKLPQIRKMLALDAKAAFNGDPAARGVGETIFSYPSMLALTHHRIAHELYSEDVPLIPRIISEMAHSATGIDIHPGANIGEYFFIDHGTGTVIGETCIIGNNVRIYQGVTLGAKSFPLDGSGNPVKGISRHPIVEDDVVIYSGATILGRVTIGKGAEIGGNVWVTKDIPSNARIMQGKPQEFYFEDGLGI